MYIFVDTIYTGYIDNSGIRSNLHEIIELSDSDKKVVRYII